MAKSTRSKVKRSFRAKKREDGVYAAVEAARLQRLNTKLQAIRETEVEEDVQGGEGAEEAERTKSVDPSPNASPDTMELDTGSTETLTTSNPTNKKISTHGLRGSRREEWRSSKGLNPRPRSKGMNRQGGIAAKSRPGRAHRRR